MGVTLSDTGDSAGSAASTAEARRLAEDLVAAGRGGDEARALLAESLDWAGHEGRESARGAGADATAPWRSRGSSSRRTPGRPDTWRS